MAGHAPGVETLSIRREFGRAIASRDELDVREAGFVSLIPDLNHAPFAGGMTEPLAPAFVNNVAGSALAVWPTSPCIH